MDQNIQQDNALIPRPPIVVVLGHVDHGKTSLLDYIRKTKVTEQEAGGITQHIGAYEIEIKGHKITFLDTPGHEAFTKIRSRGAKAADIALLVVAADESIKPQTKESLECIKEAKIPFIVVLTKIDKESANPQKVKSDLAELGVFVEGWGGDIPVVEVSSKTGQGIDDLLEIILLVSEMENLKGDLNKKGRGFVLESYMDSKRGITATLVITDGTVKLGDKIIVSSSKGKIKIMEDFLGKNISVATFSSPIRVIGFETIPPVGHEFICYENESELKNIKQEMEKKNKIKELGAKEENCLQIPVILKTDTLSSGEALEYLLDQLGKAKKWIYKVLLKDIGDLSESDCKIAPNNLTLIILFRVGIKSEVNNILLNNTNLIIVKGEIIYEIEEQLIKIIEDKFINKPTEEILGKLKVLVIFNPEKGKQLIGGVVEEGIVKNKTHFHLYRNNELIGEGKLINLQRNRVDVNEVNTGLECGLLIDCNRLIEKDDLLEFYQKI
jgi:translation initiation factor IF-2